MEEVEFVIGKGGGRAGRLYDEKNLGEKEFCDFLKEF